MITDVSYSILCAIICACTSSHPGTNIYTMFPVAYRCVSFCTAPRIFILHSVALPCALMTLSTRSFIILQPSGFRCLRFSFYWYSISPLLLVISIFFVLYNRLDPFFYPLVSSDFHVGEYGLRHIYLTEVGTAISSSASSSFLATSYLFAAPSRRKSVNKKRSGKVEALFVGILSASKVVIELLIHAKFRDLVNCFDRRRC